MGPTRLFSPAIARRSRLLTCAAGVSLAAAIAGCAASSDRRAAAAADPTTQPLVEQNLLPPASTQPSNVSVRAPDFDALWAACDAVARDLLFRPAVQDRRGGLYQTEPMLSGQWFEPWRRELRTADARVQSSIASIRRTLSFDVERAADGTFAAKPIVRVERYSLSERRVTSSASYRSVFRDRTSRNAQIGTAERDAGVLLPDAYWYDVGNDPALERYVADHVERALANARR